jgi:hypothetical protein
MEGTIETAKRRMKREETPKKDEKGEMDQTNRRTGRVKDQSQRLKSRR